MVTEWGGGRRKEKIRREEDMVGSLFNIFNSFDEEKVGPGSLVESEVLLHSLL